MMAPGSPAGAWNSGSKGLQAEFDSWVTEKYDEAQQLSKEINS